jgi:hypothetical protein
MRPSSIAAVIRFFQDCRRHRQVAERDRGQASGSATASGDLALASFASGYQALFFVSACFMFIATVLTWFLVSAAETPPVAPSSVAIERA